MEIENQPFGFRPIKVQTVNANAGFHIEVQFFKWNIIFILEVCRKFLRFEDEFILNKISDDEQYYIAQNNIDQSWMQSVDINVKLLLFRDSFQIEAWDRGNDQWKFLNSYIRWIESKSPFFRQANFFQPEIQFHDDPFKEG